MDTLDKILSRHEIPAHLTLMQGEFETVIVTEYPHGYDVAHRYICDSLDDAFQKATGTPIGFTVKAYAWRIYNWKKEAIAQSPNLHQWLPDDTLELQNKLVEIARDRDEWRDSCKLANRRFETNDHAEKEAFKYRKLLEDVANHKTPVELKRIVGEIRNVLKKREEEIK